MNFDIGLPIERLRQPVRAAIAGEADVTDMVVEAVNRTGRAVTVRVRTAHLRNPTADVVGAIVLMDALAPAQLRIEGRPD